MSRPPRHWLARAPGRAQSGSKIVIGQSAALSGPASALGEQFRIGAQLVFDRINAHGGIGGRPIELRSMDDGYEPDRCAENTRKLIEGGAEDRPFKGPFSLALPLRMRGMSIVSASAALDTIAPQAIADAVLAETHSPAPPPAL